MVQLLFSDQLAVEIQDNWTLCYTHGVVVFGIDIGTFEILCRYGQNY